MWIFIYSYDVSAPSHTFPALAPQALMQGRQVDLGRLAAILAGGKLSPPDQRQWETVTAAATKAGAGCDVRANGCICATCV